MGKECVWGGGWGEVVLAVGASALCIPLSFSARNS